MFAIPGGSQGVVSKFLVGSTNDTAGTSQTHSGLAIGSPDPQRLVVAIVSWNDNDLNPTLITGVTCGGVAMTKAIGTTYSDNGDGAAIYYLNVASGATADFVVSCNSTFNYSGVMVYELHGLNSLTPTAATFAEDTLAMGYAETNIDVVNGGAVLWGCHVAGIASFFNHTYDGISVPDDYDAKVLDITRTAASKIADYTKASVAIRATSGYTSVKYLVAAVWR